MLAFADSYISEHKRGVKVEVWSISAHNEACDKQNNTAFNFLEQLLIILHSPPAL